MKEKGSVGALLKDTLRHRGMTQVALAKKMGVDEGVLRRVIWNSRRLTPDLALRLERCLGFAARALLDLQNQDLLEEARKKYESSGQSLPS